MKDKKILHELYVELVKLQKKIIAPDPAIPTLPFSTIIS